MHIRTRNDLIKWLEDNAPRPCIKRALTEGGTNENLGGFGIYFGGWVVIVRGKVQEWIVNVEPYTTGEYRAFILGKVPWKHWEGDKSKNPLYQGDNPEKYKEMRDGNQER